MPLNLRDIEIFRALMRAGTVKAAAELLHVSQPAASKLLAGAERRSGLRLFDRVKGRLVPTPQAYLLYPDVENVWRTIEKARETASNLSGPTVGHLRIAASSRFCTFLVPRALEVVRRHYPELKIKVELILPDRLGDAMATGTIDLAVTMIRNLPPGVSTLRAYTCSLVCALPAGHPLARRRSIDAKDLEGAKLITMAKDAPLAAALEPFHLGFTPSEVSEQMGIEVTSGAVACWFAQAGTGITVVDAATVAGDAFPGLVIRRLKPDVVTTARVIRNPHTPLSDAGELFCSALDDLWRRHVPFVSKGAAKVASQAAQKAAPKAR